MREEITNAKSMPFEEDHLLSREQLDEAFIRWQEHQKTKFYFTFDFKTYWCKLNIQKFKRAYALEKNQNPNITDEEAEKNSFIRNCEITKIANCLFKILYSQIEQDTEEYSYYLEIRQSEKKHAKSAFTARQLANQSDFKQKVIGSLSGATYIGNTLQLNAIYMDQAPSIRAIRTIRYIGYYPEVKAYIFNHYAVYKGHVYPKNEDDYFELPHCSVKSIFEITTLNPHPDYNHEWLSDFITVFGDKGLVALSYWLGTLFAEQIRSKFKAWPFLEITGEAGAGKSLLLEFLWKLLGRETYEGINPSTSSDSGRARTLAQVSNLPVVLIEGDISDPTVKNHKQKQFSFEELKPLFNGRSPRTLGMKNNQNNTDDQPFRGGIVISQNLKVAGSEAILSRLIYLHFDRSHHNEHSLKSAMRLERLNTEKLSGFLFHALKHEESIMNMIADRLPSNRNTIMALSGVNMHRIGLTHGLMLSCLQALCEILPITDNRREKTERFIHQLAIERERDLSSDHPIVDQFWDLYEYFEGEFQNPNTYPLNHSPNPDEIALNLNEFYSYAHKNQQTLDDIKLMKKLLKQSVRYPFIAIKTVRSAISKKPIRCYIFKNRRSINHEE